MTLVGAALLISAAAIGVAASVFPQVTKYEGVKVPSSSWSPSLVSEAGTSAVCAVKAQSAQKFFYKWNEGEGKCETGAPDDTEGLGDEGGENLFVKEVPWVGLAIENRASGAAGGEVEFILPNGKICSSSEHGLPNFPHNRDEPGVAAAGDALYVSSGVGSNGDKTYRLDLSSPSPTWEHVATQQGGSYQILPSGLVPFTDPADKKTRLFQFGETYCESSGNPGVQVFDVEANSWSVAQGTYTRIKQ